jgi:hypothetical protein
MFVGDSDDQASFALKQLGFCRWQNWRGILGFSFGHVCIHVVVCDFLDRSECLATIPGIINVRNFPAIDPKMTFTPGRNVDFQPVIAEQSDKLLNCCSLSNSQSLIGFPFQCS